MTANTKRLCSAQPCWLSPAGASIKGGVSAEISHAAGPGQLYLPCENYPDLEAQESIHNLQQRITPGKDRFSADRRELYNPCGQQSIIANRAVSTDVEIIAKGSGFNNAELAASLPSRHNGCGYTGLGFSMIQCHA